MMDHRLDTRTDRPGYRLHRLEVVNWGTFDSTDGTVYRFEPEGRTSLLVGHNGSGKSTLVDAILTLLVDSRTRNYNVAAGAKKTERTAKSYIKGAFDRTSDETQSSVVKFLRPKGNHLTALLAVFRDEQLDRAFTIAQVLYLKGDGSDDKVFGLADSIHDLRQDLAGLKKAEEVREHLKSRGYQTTKTYVEYHEWLMKRTKMHGKAIDMFNQTVAVKDIQSLNMFIRRHMLEAHDWRDKVQRLLTHFNDLSVAHQELVRAKQAEELLTPIERLGKKYQRQAEELRQLEQELEAGTTYFPLLLIDVFGAELTVQRQNVVMLVAVIARLDEELRATRESIRQLRNEIDRAGGERLRQLPDLIRIEETHLHHKRVAYEHFHGHLEVCNIPVAITSQDNFVTVRSDLQQAFESSESRMQVLRDQYEAAIGQKASVDRELREERNEFELLQQRRSNLPSRFTSLRSRLCADLHLDENVLPFAAELMAVQPHERRWEASIETVLRSFSLSLLVPDRYYQRVRGYVERNQLTDGRGEGQRLDYVCVGKVNDATGDRIDPRSLYNKLLFKPRHDLSPWVRAEILRRFDFRCCENVDEFNDVARFAMTANRHIKFNTERHQKDDRPNAVDPRSFVLGWDNTEKKRYLLERIRDLESQQRSMVDNIARHTQSLEELSNIVRAARSALAINDFDAIDVGRHQREIAALQEEKRQLEESNDAVKSLRQRLRESERLEANQSSERDDRLQQRAKLEHEILQVERMITSAQAEIQASKDSGRFASHALLFDTIRESLAEGPLAFETFASRRLQWETARRNRVTQLRQPLQEMSEKLVGLMSRYLREFREEATDLDASVYALDSFLGLLDHLRKEDLPRHEKKFKDRLNDQVSQEVGLFNTELRQEQKQIEEKIAQLNKALADVEYSRGTIMRLEPRLVQDAEIDEFRRSLRECLDDSLEHTDEANEARFHRIQSLVARLSDKERTRWRDKVIDVRNWYDFAAQEIERASGALRSCYDGSSGQSGGEKAKLAFTILVAALAYQLDVDPTGKTPGRFQFVVVDEMFSKVDDQNAEYALRLFEQFGLQLLIVAPLDAKARVTEPFVDRYLHVVKDSDTSRSQIFSMTALEYEHVVKRMALRAM